MRLIYCILDPVIDLRTTECDGWIRAKLIKKVHQKRGFCAISCIRWEIFDFFSFFARMKNERMNQSSILWLLFRNQTFLLLLGSTTTKSQLKSISRSIMRSLLLIAIHLLLQPFSVLSSLSLEKMTIKQ
jgi:hypothetical protein